tara:strand:- start:166 stop:378 length:213 start_codon:yes stop_codon:yes gene_type:complete
MKNRFLNQEIFENKKYQTLKVNASDKKKIVDINILLNRIKVDKNKTKINNLKKLSFLSFIVCVTALFAII